MLATVIDKFVQKAPPELLARLVKHIPRPIFDLKRNEAFRYVVRYAYRNSPFYRKKFDELKIDPRRVKGPKDLGDFYTMPIDIIEHAEEFLCRPPHIVFESSGTTGRNKRIYMTQDELDTVGKFNAIGLFLGGVTKEDRLVNAFDFCIWIPGMITQKGIEKARVFGMAAGKVDPIEVYKRIPIYKFNIVMGEPTWLIKLTEIAEKEGSYPLKFIIGAAEGMPEAAIPWMEKVWQGARVHMVYATVESTGIIAFEPFRVCKNYHIDENNFFVEIVSPGKDGYGEICFTTLNRRTMPLIRYRNRDVSKIIEEKCPCGVSYRKLARLRGRADEMVIASGGNLYPLMFEDILKDVEGITSDWQMVFKLRGIKEVMEFNLELKAPAASKEAVKEKVFDNIKSRYPDLWKNYSIRIFEIAFAYHSAGELRVNRKIVRVVDERYAK